MKKRMMSVVLLLLIVLLTACNTPSGFPKSYLYDRKMSDDEKERLKEILLNLKDNEKDCPDYDLEKYMKYLWDTEIVYNESVYPLENKDGSISPIELMYEPVCILSVRDSSLKTTYKKGVDYDLRDGKLVILKSGSIPRVKYKDYWLDQPVSGKSFPRTGGGHILFGEGEPFLSRQLAVTYIHLDKWQGAMPEGKSNLLPKTSAKLQNKEELKIVYYGDSISAGCNSSGFQKVEPFADDWPTMVTEYLKKMYQNESITMVNASVGGKNSNWALSNVANVAGLKPDLVVIGFGMNDGTALIPANVYANNISSIMNKILDENENCEFILIGTMLANENVANFAGYQEDYLPELMDLEKEGVAVADMTTLHKYLLTKKRYFDMTGNNVNHPNDFLARFYAQVIIKTMTEQKEA